MSQPSHLNFEIILPKNIKNSSNSKNCLKVKNLKNVDPIKIEPNFNCQSTHSIGMRLNRAQSELSSSTTKNALKIKTPLNAVKYFELQPPHLAFPTDSSEISQVAFPKVMIGQTVKSNNFSSIKAHQNKFGTFDLRIIEPQKECNNSTQANSNKKESSIKSNNSTKNKLSNLLQISNCQFCKQKKTLQKLSKNILYEAYEAKTTMIYNTNIINDIIFNANCMACARFKDYLIYDERTEFIKKFNDTATSINLIKDSSAFYLKYSKVFPNYILLPEKKYMFKGIEKKQKFINERHNELIKKSKGIYVNSNGLQEIFNDEFLKQVEKSLTRNKVSKIETNYFDLETCGMKELLDKYMEHDTLYESFKNEELFSMTSEYFDSSFTKPKEKNKLIQIAKLNEADNFNEAKIIIALNDRKKGITKHQRVQSSSNAFSNNISPSNANSNKKAINMEQFKTKKREIILKTSTNKRNERLLKISCTIKPRSRANSNRKQETIPTQISSTTKISIRKTFNQNGVEKKENINSHLTTISPSQTKRIKDNKEKRSNFENVPKAATRSNVHLIKESDKNYLRKNLSVKKFNNDKGSNINIKSNANQKVVPHQAKGKKIADISRQNTMTTSGKTLLFMKGGLGSNISSPKKIQLVYNTARNINSKNKI